MSSSERNRRGLLLVVSAPSGTGKTTVVERLVQVTPESGALALVHVAQRPDGETDGIDYNFITRTRFEAMVAADAFLEWADVFGNFYGTCAEDAERELAAGRDLVLVIDVQGARQVRARCPGTVGVFVLPPSYEVLERRLRGRSKDSEAAMQRRLRTARKRSRRLSSTITWWSTTSSTRASSAFVPCCWPSAPGCGRCAGPPKRSSRPSTANRRYLRRARVIDRSRTNAFEFVIVAGERAKQLMRGCTPRTTSAATDKIVEIAQKEVREGKVAKVPVAID